MNNPDSLIDWMVRTYIAALLVIALLLPATGQGISVSQSVDRTEMPFEETAIVEIVVSWDGSPLAYRFDKALTLQADRLKVTKFSSKVSSTGSGPDEVTTKVFRYTLSPTSSGLGTIEPITVEYVSWPDSIAGELLTDPMTIAIAEPVPVERAGSTGVSTLIWLAVAGAVVAVVVVVVYVMKRRRPREIAQTPAQTFLDELSTLRQRAGDDLKTFQTGLYKSLLAYVTARYQLDLAGKPTEAIILELEGTEVNQSTKEKLSGWLARAEKEKFSPGAATPGEIIRLESEIREFFEKLH